MVIFEIVGLNRFSGLIETIFVKAVTESTARLIASNTHEVKDVKNGII